LILSTAGGGDAGTFEIFSMAAVDTSAGARGTGCYPHTDHRGGVTKIASTIIVFDLEQKKAGLLCSGFEFGRRRQEDSAPNFYPFEPFTVCPPITGVLNNS